jgi:hypothetical protein
MVTKLPIIRLGAKVVSNLRLALLLAVIPAVQVVAQEPAAPNPPAAPPAQPPITSQATDAQGAANAQAAQSQQTINNTVDQTMELSTQYAQALAELDSFNKYNEQLQEQINGQLEEIESVQTQLVEIETTNREVLPLMERMVETLGQFVAADIPIYIDERTERVRLLQDLMGQANVTISEKYRRILEAYLIELDYGSTLSTYQGALGTGSDARTVQFVQLGRISLMYQTLDGAETGYWDANAKNWVVDNSYADAVDQAMEVAGGGAPELLSVAIPAPKEVR